ncbi:hypothetical protein Scep_012334 [Stephania cephalantha]|uniref:Uncharacterized protein n=1 Tax=Stephania cephalantha TaxID=152367 RepID=A0AAP0P9R7_9MAGN
MQSEKTKEEEEGIQAGIQSLWRSKLRIKLSYGEDVNQVREANWEGKDRILDLRIMSQRAISALTGTAMDQVSGQLFGTTDHWWELGDLKYSLVTLKRTHIFVSLGGDRGGEERKGRCGGEKSKGGEETSGDTINDGEEKT